MRFALSLIFALCVGGLSAQDSKPERNLLLAKRDTITIGSNPSILKNIVPAYQIPRGNIFCRMEDAVTRKTGVWLKVGVTGKDK